MISDYYFSILRSSSPRFKFDWLYIDADHNRAGIDLANALDFCVQDSIIMMHDFMVHPNAWDTNTVVPVLEQIQKGSVVPVGISNEQFPTIVLRVT
jgi:predicted O-methyltransferase YrrM